MTHDSEAMTSEQVRCAPERVVALERIAAAAQRAFDTERILPQLVGEEIYTELRDALRATS